MAQVAAQAGSQPTEVGGGREGTGRRRALTRSGIWGQSEEDFTGLGDHGEWPRASPPVLQAGLLAAPFVGRARATGTGRKRAQSRCTRGNI